MSAPSSPSSASSSGSSSEEIMLPPMFGIGIFKRRASQSGEGPSRPAPPAPSPPKAPFRQPMPYDKPDASGRCFFMELPEEVLQLVFEQLDLQSLTRCYRLSKAINSIMNESAATSLHHTLMANSLRVNPLATWANPITHKQMPQTSAGMLSTLRERLTRFRNITPSDTSYTTLREPEGSLYEYLEGVLLRSMQPQGSARYGNEMAVYDLRKVGEWEDIEDDVDVDVDDGGGNGGGACPADEEDEHEVEEDDFRRTFRAPFTISELAVDPGQDLLVAVEVRFLRMHGSSPVYSMHFHLLSLETFKPHPLAREEVLDWPFELSSKKITLDFQICDDTFFVLNKRRPGNPIRDMLIGWQWTTGRLATILRTPSGQQQFQSFVLLSPSSFVVTTLVFEIDADLDLEGELNETTDIRVSYHLQLYAFPPFSGDAPVVDQPPPTVPTHVATIDMPPFFSNFRPDMPPADVMARTDPPPRSHFPTHPVVNPPPFQPDPTSGICVFQIDFMTAHGNAPHYVMVMHKTTLLRYMPAPTSPLLTKEFLRPVPVVPWDKIAPDARIFGPNPESPDWVCYVYQYRYVATEDMLDMSQVRFDGDAPINGTRMCVYDFDPYHVRQERNARLHRLQAENPGREIAESELEGDVDGIQLHLAPSVLPGVDPLTKEVVTGANVPYLLSKRHILPGSVPLIDSERILTVLEKPSLRRRLVGPGGERSYGEIRAMQF